MGLLLTAAFTLCVLLALGAGFMAHYARDVKRNPLTTRFFAAVGIGATLLGTVLGVVMLDG